MLFLAACSGGGADDRRDGRPARSTSPAEPTAAAPAPSPTVQADPAKQPQNPAQARELIRQVITDPELFDAPVRKATPYESDPATWSVLRGDCEWERRALPKDVLATLTRYFELPAAGGKGPVRMTATVTVHPTTLDAAWEQAGMLEESVGCREQTLRRGERLVNLRSNVSAWGEGGNRYADDSLIEMGECVSEAHGGPHPYWYQQATFGPVVVSLSSCAGKGWTKEAMLDLSRQPVPQMLLRAEQRIGRPTGQSRDGKRELDRPGASASAKEDS